MFSVLDTDMNSIVFNPTTSILQMRKQRCIDTEDKKRVEGKVEIHCWEKIK